MASIKIKGIGIFAGTRTETFRIRLRDVEMSNVSRVKGGFVATWKKATKNEQKAMSGYQIQYARDSKFNSAAVTKTTNRKSAHKVKISGLKSKKTYYVRLRTFVKKSGKTYYSNWSNEKRVKTK